MAANVVLDEENNILNKKKVIQDIWHAKLSSDSIKEAKADNIDTISSSEVIENLVHIGLGGTVKHPLYCTQLQNGLQMKVFPPNTVTECLTKLLLGKKISSYSSAIDILDTCCDLMRNNHDGSIKPVDVCLSISQGTYWLLENTIEVHKFLYAALKDPTTSSLEPEECINVIKKAQTLLNKLICLKGFEDLNFIGKRLFGEEQEQYHSSLQMQVQDLCSFQLDKINTNSFYTVFENHLKEFMKIISKFLSTAPKFTSIERSRGHAPSQSLHIFLQTQVFVYLSIKSSKVAEILDNWVQLENIPVDQLFMDLFRFVSYNILVRKVPNEVTLFTAFMFIKLPVVMHNLDIKYKHQTTERTIFGSTYQQFLQLPFDDLDAILGCDTFKVFVSQCQANKALESKQCDQLLKLRQISQMEHPQAFSDSILNKLLLILKKGEEIQKKICLSIEDNRDKVSQELQNLLNNPDLHMILTTYSANDAMTNLITALLRINNQTERCPDGLKDIHAEVRADLFNNSFLLLIYIDTVFGDKVFLDTPKELENIFFSTWRKRCRDITSRKMYDQAILDSMMEPLLSSYIPSVNNAQWDQYCWSIGMIVKELTQAHLRHHIKTDALQKVCENLKNKRPALCIAAVCWLCVQYKTMPSSERARTVKIIMLFKRPLPVAVKAAIMTPILTRYSAPLASTLQTSSKNKQAVEETPKSRNATFAALINDLMPSKHSVLFEQGVIANIFELNKQIGYQTFSESLMKHLLETGKEEEAKLFCDMFTCLILVEPIEILSIIFTRVLKFMFFCTKTPKMFSNPHGLYLARCISKAFTTSLILFDTIPSENPRQIKVAKITYPSSGRDILIDAFITFLQDSIPVLNSNEINAVTTFVITLIEQVGISSALLKKPIKLNQEVVKQILKLIPPDMSRDTITMLCDTSTQEGRDAAATFLVRQSNI